MKAVRSATVAVAALALGLSLAACSSAEAPATSEATESSETRSFTAGGETIEIPSDPTRIVACGYAVLPLIQAGANLVGVCEWTRELDAMSPEDLATYEELPKLAAEADVSTLDYEAITALEPDLIIMGVPSRAKEFVDLEALETLAPTIFLGPTAPSEWRTLGDSYADAANVGDSYGEFRTQYEARAEDIENSWSDEFSGVSFGSVCGNCGAETGMFTREYRSSYTSNLLDDLGLDIPGQPADPADVHAEDLSIENLAQSFAGIDVIVYGVQADGSVLPGLADLMNTEGWKALPAVQAGNLIPIVNYSAATFETAIPALDSIDKGLAEIAPRLQ